MKNLILTLLIFVPFSISAQQNTLNGRIMETDAKKVFLSDFYGAEKRAFDSTAVDKNGSFMFTLPKNQPAGMLRLRFGENRFIDVISNREDIVFETYANAPITNQEEC